MKCLFDETHDYEIGHCCEAERRAHIQHLEAALQAAFGLLREKDRQLQKAQHDRDRYHDRLKKLIKLSLDDQAEPPKL